MFCGGIYRFCSLLQMGQNLYTDAARWLFYPLYTKYLLKYPAQYYIVDKLQDNDLKIFSMLSEISIYIFFNLTRTLFW